MTGLCPTYEIRNSCYTMCPAINAPVCGFNGSCYKEFVNACLMKVDNCNAKINGETGKWS